MTKDKKRKFKSLFWQISVIFILVLVIFAGISLYISINSSRNYSVEVTQKINWDLASNTVTTIKPQFLNIQNVDNFLS